MVATPVVAEARPLEDRPVGEATRHAGELADRVTFGKRLPAGRGETQVSEHVLLRELVLGHPDAGRGRPKGHRRVACQRRLENRGVEELVLDGDVLAPLEEPVEVPRILVGCLAAADDQLDPGQGRRSVVRGGQDDGTVSCSEGSLGEHAGQLPVTHDSDGRHASEVKFRRRRVGGRSL